MKLDTKCTTRAQLVAQEILREVLEVSKHFVRLPS